MQAPEPWRIDNLGSRVRPTRCLAAGRSLLVQAKMRPALMVIADVIVHQALQMPFIHDNHMVEKIASAVADPSFSDTILPRTTETRSFWLNAEALHRAYDVGTKSGVPVEDQILWRRVVRKCLAQLLNDPCARRVPGHIAVEDSPPVMRDNEEAEESAERERGHGEEIHRGDGLALIVQKRRPSLCRLWVSRSPSHPTQNGSLQDVKTQHSEFAMNPRRAPRPVLRNHAEDQAA